MPKVRSVYVCQQCNYQSPSLLGRCPECGSWGSLVEQISEPENTSRHSRSVRNPEIINISQIEQQNIERVSTQIGEFDRVLGGGIVRGSVVLVSGDPGIGKSTLLSQLALNIKNTLYAAGEESPQQIKIRIERIKKDADLLIINETDVDAIVEGIKQTKPALVIVDSIQTLETQDLQAAPGSVSQVRESAHRLQRIAKSAHVPIFIVGHVTKEGTIAGPRTLEHLVDVVLTLEGDPSNQFRVLRANKNRFGPTDEVGIFDMGEQGMKEVTNPSKLFLDTKVNAPGSAVVPILSGLRPMLVEVQALVTKSFIPVPRRSSSGVDNNRMQLLIAVLSKRLNLPLYDQDIFINITGGLKINEPAADLAICAAIVSSFKDKLVNNKIVLAGEVGLLGELRYIRGVDKRLQEAKKQGFAEIISPENTRSLFDAIQKALH